MIPIFMTSAKELLFYLAGKIIYPAVKERLLTRLVLYSVEELEKMDTNEVSQMTKNIIKSSLKNKKLYVMENQNG